MKTPILMVTMLAAATVFASRADDAREAAAKAAGEKAEVRESVKTEIRDAVKAEIRELASFDGMARIQAHLSASGYVLVTKPEDAPVDAEAEAKAEAAKNVAEAKAEAAKKVREANKEAMEKANGGNEVENEVEVEHTRESTKDRIRLDGRRSEVRDVVTVDPSNTGSALNIVKRDTAAP